MSGEDAMYELTINLPTRPKGEPVQIVGLGTFKNGETYVISKDEANRFRSYNSTREDILGDNGAVVGSRAVLGDTLLQVSKTMHGVEVSTVEEPKSKPQDSKKNTDTKSVATSKEGDE